jgi:hypothetical protein
MFKMNNNKIRLEQNNINEMIQLASEPVRISKKGNYRNPVKYSRSKPKNNSKKVQNIPISQMQKENGKEPSYMNTNNSARLKRKSSSKVSFKKPVDTSDPVINKIRLCVSVASPLMKQNRRVYHFCTPYP